MKEIGSANHVPIFCPNRKSLAILTNTLAAPCTACNASTVKEPAKSATAFMRAIAVWNRAREVGFYQWAAYRMRIPGRLGVEASEPPAEARPPGN